MEEDLPFVVLRASSELVSLRTKIVMDVAAARSAAGIERRSTVSTSGNIKPVARTRRGQSRIQAGQQRRARVKFLPSASSGEV